MQEDSGIFTKFLIGLGVVVTAALGFLTKVIVDRRKTNAEAQNISTSSNIAEHDMHRADAREYREMFKQAEDAIRKSRREWMKAEFFIREMLFKMKSHSVPGWEEDEKRFNEMTKEFEG